MATTVRPLGDRVLVQELPDEEVSKGGVVIPDQAREKPQRGLVLAVGDGRWEASGGKAVLIPMMVDAGDVVLFSKYAGTEVPGPGVLGGSPKDRTQQLILRDADLLGVERAGDPEAPTGTAEAVAAADAERVREQIGKGGFGHPHSCSPAADDVHGMARFERVHGYPGDGAELQPHMVEWIDSFPDDVIDSPHLPAALDEMGSQVVSDATCHAVIARVREQEAARRREPREAETPGADAAGGPGSRVERLRRRTPEGMEPMPDTGGVDGQYTLVSRAAAEAAGWTVAGRQQEERDGYVYDYEAQSYWTAGR